MSKMISEFVREQKRYSQNNLRQIFKLRADEVSGFIRSLKAFGVLKSVKNNVEQKDLSDLLDEDIEITEIEVSDDTYLYVFTYVGVITIGARIIKCYPKYILNHDNPINEMKQVLKVLNKYGVNEQIVNLYNGDGHNKSFNILAVILFLINDYHEIIIQKMLLRLMEKVKFYGIKQLMRVLLLLVIIALIIWNYTQKKQLKMNMTFLEDYMNVF